MAQQIINNGSYDNDLSAESVRTSFEKTKSNFSELYTEQKYLFGELISQSAIPVNDSADLYAHDSVIYVKQFSSKEYAFIVYQCDRTTKNEYATTMEIRLIIFDLQTRSVMSNIEVLKGNTTYGAITTHDSACAKPRIHDLGSSLRIVAANYQTIYYRDLSLTTLELGSLNVLQFTIRNASNDGWDASPIDATETNLETHCFRCTGKNFPTDGANPIMPHCGGIDNVQSRVIGATTYYYCSFEAYFPNYGDYGIAFLAESTDKINWRLYPPIAVDDATYVNNRTSETSFIYINDRWNAVSRATANLYSYSLDGGFTWSAQEPFGISNSTSPKKGADYANIRKGLSTYVPTAFFAYNKTTEIYKATYGRCTLALAITQDMINFTDIAIINNYRTNHYPSVHYLEGFLYLVFTTSMKATNTDRNTLMLSKINLWRQFKI
jgi:hypothetical protein